MAMTQTAEQRYTKPVLVAINKPLDEEDSLEALRSHALFCNLRPKDLDSLIQQSRRLRLGHRQLLYRQDMPAHHFFFVISGRLRLYRLDSSGIDRTLDSLAPGERSDVHIATRQGAATEVSTRIETAAGWGAGMAELRN